MPSEQTGDGRRFFIRTDDGAGVSGGIDGEGQGSVVAEAVESVVEGNDAAQIVIEGISSSERGSVGDDEIIVHVDFTGDDAAFAVGDEAAGQGECVAVGIKAGSFEGVGAVQEHQVVCSHGLNGEGVGGGFSGVGDGSGDDAGLRAFRNRRRRQIGEGGSGGGDDGAAGGCARPGGAGGNQLPAHALGVDVVGDHGIEHDVGGGSGGRSGDRVGDVNRKGAGPDDAK